MKTSLTIAIFLTVIGITSAYTLEEIATIAGRCLSRRRCYSFALVMACVECLFIPFGTILGVFTISVLLRESVKALFAATQTSV